MRAAPREIVDLTICRAIFAAWVFAYHVDLHARFSASLGAVAGLVRRGYLGVDGFFLLSGLILALVHPELGQSRGGELRFWARRLGRLYPVHLTVLLLLAAVYGLGTGLGVTARDPGRFTLPSFGENLLLIHGWGVMNRLAWNYPSWSISTEWAGYLLFPVIWLGIARMKQPMVVCLLALCLPVLALVDVLSNTGLNLTFAHSLFRFFPEFVLGITTARLLPTIARQVPAWALAVSGVAVLLLALIFAADVFVVAGIWLVLTGFACQAVSGRPALLPRAPFLRFLGVLSYAFYMSFSTIELFLAQLYRHQGWDPASGKFFYTVAMTGLTFMLALSLHSLVETPARAQVDRWLKQRALPSLERPPLV